jgi:ubiquinone/menaquinone biosynthesis C-methylase UbiE
MTNVYEHEATRPATSRGIILHSPRFYDLLVFIATRGRESAFREKVLDLARLEPGASVLDVGCGTGTLAIAAKRRIGHDGKVSGIDASPEMIGRASKKARNAGVEIEFRNQSIGALPFADGQFDVVFSTVMLHHLPRKVREVGMREIRRVLKPGGRVLVVDFAGTERQHGLLGHLHRRHGHVSPAEIIALLKNAGLNVVESGAVGVRDLHYALAQSPCCHQ